MGSGDLGNVFADASRASVESFTYLWGTLIQLALQVVTLMVVGRALGPEGYGVYALSFIPLSIMASFTDFGIDQALLRFSSLYLGKGDHRTIAYLLKRTLLLKLLVSLIASAPLLALPEYMAEVIVGRSELGFYVALASASILGQTLTYTFMSFHAGIGMARHRVYVSITQSAIRLIAVIVLLYLGMGIAGAILAYVLSYYASVILALALTINYLRIKDDRVSNVSLLEFIKFSLALFSAGVMGLLISRYQAVLLAYITSPLGDAGDVLVGNFNASLQLLYAILSVYSAIAVPLTPLFSKLVGRGIRDEALDLYRYTTLTLTFITMPLTTYAIIYSTDVIRTVYGPRYSEAPLAFALLSAQLFLWPMSVTVGSILQAHGFTRTIVYSSIISGLAAFPLMYFLSIKWSIYGLALAIGVYGIPSLAYCLIMAKRSGITLDLLHIAKTSLIGIASAALTTPFIYVSMPAIVRLTLGLVTMLSLYIPLVVVSGALRYEDAKALEMLLSSIALLKPFIGLLMKFMKLMFSLKYKTVPASSK
ncbi:MAG: oligosaccharide flippase family protein [Sulfolobales archaeon]|nr:oligosaccharide flippase family protein [Sulfolobales archaeon]MCX8199292.1 oligosaccharide flippase family protein [Sulfolobales archaeon]MDW8170394.1 oligosaccharide flippase family protein [Desulfurococcaceae archaeon]